MSDLTDEQIIEEMMARDPLFFIEQLRIPVEGHGTAKFGDRMDPWQRDDFLPMVPSLMHVAGLVDQAPDINQFYRQRARGHSKTSDIAAAITWLLWASPRPLDGYGVAEDKEQAGLIKKQMFKIGSDNPWLRGRLDYQKNIVKNIHTQGTFTIMSSDTASSWGLTPDFVVADELTHWTKEDFWSSIVSSFAKKNGMLIVGCNAGMGRDWKWRVREHARLDPYWHYSAPEGCVASWISQKALDQQRGLLPQTEYSRVWLNLWQETGGEFVSEDEVRSCRNEKLAIRDRTENDGWRYVAALDYAPKHDRTVGIVGHQMDDKIVIDRMDVICPRVTGTSTRVDWCEQWMENIQRDFGGDVGEVYFVVDKYELVGVIERLRDRGFIIEEFDFKSGTGNWELSLILRFLIIHQQVQWYPDCGDLPTPWGKDNLETELASLIVENYAGGRRWRFNHLQDDTHHDDRAFALGALCHFIVMNSGGYAEWGIEPPARQGMFGSLGSAA